MGSPREQQRRRRRLEPCSSPHPCPLSRASAWSRTPTLKRGRALCAHLDRDGRKHGSENKGHLQEAGTLPGIGSSATQRDVPSQPPGMTPNKKAGPQFKTAQRASHCERYEGRFGKNNHSNYSPADERGGRVTQDATARRTPRLRRVCRGSQAQASTSRRVTPARSLTYVAVRIIEQCRW